MAREDTEHRLGWLGTGRMGSALVQRLLAGGCDVAVYNRTTSKAEPLAALGATVVGSAAQLADRDIVFATVGTPQDLLDAVLGPAGLISGGSAPKIVVDASTISVEASQQVRERLEKLTDKVNKPDTGAEWMRPLRGIEILERIGNDDALTHLRTLAAGGDSPPTRAAKEALGRLGVK